MFFSCITEVKPLIVGRNESDPEYPLSMTFNIQLNSDSTFEYSIVPNDSSLFKPGISRGRFSIKSDTLVFKDHVRFKKAIIKNGELNFIGNYFKINIIENNSNMDMNFDGVKYEDFSQFLFDPAQPYFFEEGTNCEVNDADIQQLKSFIQHKMVEQKDRFKYHSLQNEYYKQIICVIDKKGDKIVYINCITKKIGYDGSRSKYEIMEVLDGGENYFQLLVNLSKLEVEWFYVNGVA